MFSLLIFALSLLQIIHATTGTVQVSTVLSTIVTSESLPILPSYFNNYDDNQKQVYYLLEGMHGKLPNDVAAGLFALLFLLSRDGNVNKVLKDTGKTSLELHQKLTICISRIKSNLLNSFIVFICEEGGDLCRSVSQCKL